MREGLGSRLRTCFSGDGEERHEMRVLISVSRIVRRVRACDCTTLFHTCHLMRFGLSRYDILHDDVIGSARFGSHEP